MKHILLLLALLLTNPNLSVFQASQEGVNPGTPVKGTRLRSYPVPWSFEDYSGIQEPLRTVIRDGEAWSGMWKRIYRWSSPLPPPEIDFSNEMVIVVALGARPTGGYGIVVEGSYDRDDKLEIIVSSHSPGKRCFLTQLITSPVDIVRVPKAEGPVVFHENKVVHECR